MKDRIRKIMESQHMTQQTFAQFIEMSPASLSSIFNGRTRPTLNIIEAIKNKIPAISTDWLMFGSGPMYLDSSDSSEDLDSMHSISSSEALLDFDDSSTTPSVSASYAQNAPNVNAGYQAKEKISMKNIDKPQRQITEIRIFYDDQTWETFTPKK